jgi:hypothetical protein
MEIAPALYRCGIRRVRVKVRLMICDSVERREWVREVIDMVRADPAGVKNANGS